MMRCSDANCSLDASYAISVVMTGGDGRTLLKPSGELASDFEEAVTFHLCAMHKEEFIFQFLREEEAQTAQIREID